MNVNQAKFQKKFESRTISRELPKGSKKVSIFHTGAKIYLSEKNILGLGVL